MRLISDVLEDSAEVSKARINANSVATAKLGAMVATAFGNKNTRAKISDFLPYEMNEEGDTTTKATREVLRWAVKTQKLPSTIVAMLGSELS